MPDRFSDALLVLAIIPVILFVNGCRVMGWSNPAVLNLLGRIF